ncbi:MAG: Gfo/Idh/MocA family oxidoreductase [Planctomycetales bacterium]
MMLKDYPLKVGLIGTGGIALGQHLPAWMTLPGAKVTGLADVSRDSLERAAETCDATYLTEDYRELLARDDVEIIDICAPSALHARVSIDALEAGKHVLCEKPMATSSDDAARVLDAAERSGKKFMVAQQFRLDPRSTRLMDHLSRHPLGTVYYARAQWLRRRFVPGQPAFTEKRLSGGGPLFDLGVHLLDLAWTVMGRPDPVSVSAGTYNHLAQRDDLGSDWTDWDPKSMDVEDFAVGLIRFANGSLLTLESSWLGFQPEAERTAIQWYGSQSGAIWPDGCLSGEENRVPWDLQLRDAPGEKAHHALIRRFAEAVLQDEPPPISPRDSFQVVQMLDAMYRSATSGREEPVG